MSIETLQIHTIIGYTNYVKISNPTASKGEDIAAEFLQKKGYKILERNFRKKYGEVDIIALHQNVLIFIEVKTRSSSQFGTGFEAITSSKLQSIINTAQLYKSMHSRLPESLRIDAISVLLTWRGELEEIEHMENLTG